MARGNRFRLGAAILVAGALLGTAGASQAAIAGTYTGGGKSFAISFDVHRGRVDDLTVACSRGAITVAATGADPKVKKGAFVYSGPARSSNRSKTIHMNVTGTFTDKGKKVKGTAFTAGVCNKGKYTAKK